MTASKKLRLWEEKQKQAFQKKPLKTLKVIPSMPGIAPGDRQWLQTKALKYLLFEPQGKVIWKYLLKHPLKYGFGYLRSLLSSFVKQEEDFYLYNLDSIETWKEKSLNALVVIGFSYCEKPFECPDGRFSDQCRCDQNHLVCQQCPIGKARFMTPTDPNIHVVIIPTVHDIGIYLFELREKHPKEEILFIITACEMTLEMFKKWSKTLSVKGIGIRLTGRICNTFKAFELSEKGIKPGLTCVKSKTHEKLCSLLHHLHIKQGK